MVFSYLNCATIKEIKKVNVFNTFLIFRHVLPVLKTAKEQIQML